MPKAGVTVDCGSLLPLWGWAALLPGKDFVMAKWFCFFNEWFFESDVLGEGGFFSPGSRAAITYSGSRLHAVHGPRPLAFIGGVGLILRLHDFLAISLRDRFHPRMLDDVSLPDAAVSLRGTRDWPHAPPHRLGEAGVYFVTARAVRQRHLLATTEMRDWFQAQLFALAKHYGWTLEAWAILSNHYHLVAHSPPQECGAAMSLRTFLQHLHSVTTKECNRRDGTPGRTRLWHNYRDTHLTLQRGYLARLNYVHQNAVHHGLVALASQWKWCSAMEFKLAVSPAWVRTVASFAFDEIAQEDGE